MNVMYIHLVTFISACAIRLKFTVDYKYHLSCPFSVPSWNTQRRDRSTYFRNYNNKTDGSITYDIGLMFVDNYQFLVSRLQK